MRTLVVLFVVACGSNPVRSVEPIEVIAMTVIAAPPAHVDLPRPPKVEMVELVRTTTLRAEPRRDAAPVGIINQGTRTGVLRAITSGDCRWIELAPRGWTCERATRPTEEPPTPATSLDEDEETPIKGVYGVVRGSATAYGSRADILAETGRTLAGSNTVRAAGAIVVGGRRFWRTTQGELIDESSIAQLSPSRFKGAAITDATAMPAWVHAQKAITTYDAPHGRAVGKLAPRAVVHVEELDGSFVRISDIAWVKRSELRIATVSAPPEGTGASEKWFDVDRDEQVLVAYEGERPVYATLVSTGKYQHETPTSIARIASKLEHAVMTSDKESIYSVADVPWTMYYDRDFALHTAYWHDGFGSPRSHGCVNLAPRDARALYRWSSPDVPPGWSAVYGDAEHPGSLVRVRSHRDPAPAFRGYAQAMQIARR